MVIRVETFDWTEQSIAILSSCEGLRSVELSLLDRYHVRLLLPPSCLAPDIVEAIVRGEEPSGLSLEKLVKGFPLAWDEQREKLAG